MTETFNSRDDDCDGLVDEGFSSNGVALACTGSGQVLVLAIDEIDGAVEVVADAREGLEVLRQQLLARAAIDAMGVTLASSSR